MNRPIRVLISKIGLDGHDRGAKLIVRQLRDAGMDVVYTGLWQTPAATVQAAIQEDVDVLGVSLLSAAHMTVMPEVVRLVRQAGSADLPVIVGGIIPAQDGAKLRELGLAAVFNPGASLDEINREITRLGQAYARVRDAAPPGADVTSPLALSRTLTRAAAGTLPASAVPPSANAPVVIGVTGAPGVGKSSFIGKLARGLRTRNLRVAVVAVDPSSPLTGGAVLGDRLRMMTPDPDPGLFIRSLSSRNVAGGLAPHMPAVLAVIAAAGFDVALIETVGAGQGDTEVRTVARDVFMLVMPGGGDHVQFFKAGIMEIATAFVVSKCDVPGADATIKELRDSVEDQRPVWPVSALRDEGFDVICDWIVARRNSS